MKKSTKIAIGIGIAAVAAVAVAGIAYQLVSIRKILSQADDDEVILDELFDDEDGSAFAELKAIED